MFETYQTMMRPDSYECKLSQIIRSNEGDSMFDIRVMKNSLVTRDVQGKFTFHNRTKGASNKVHSFGPSYNAT